jgi:hypothetical protein
VASRRLTASLICSFSHVLWQAGQFILERGPRPPVHSADLASGLRQYLHQQSCIAGVTGIIELPLEHGKSITLMCYRDPSDLRDEGATGRFKQCSPSRAAFEAHAGRIERAHLVALDPNAKFLGDKAREARVPRYIPPTSLAACASIFISSRALPA